MKFVVAGGGVAGLGASLAAARAVGHDAVVLERDPVHADGSPFAAFDVERPGIPHDHALHDRIETILGRRATRPPSPPPELRPVEMFFRRSWGVCCEEPRPAEKRRRTSSTWWTTGITSRGH
jgi:glycine/D-amino acid oxidase-like deaminating enzyme